MSTDRIVARIGDVATLVRGVTYKKQDSSQEPAEGLVPLLRATNINGELHFDGLVYVPSSCVGPQQYLLVGDSVIAASSGSLSVVGKSAPLRHEWSGTFGAFCYALRPTSQHVAPFYLSYFLQTSEYRSQVSRLAAGVNINNLKRQHLEELEIPLVCLDAQHRIVEAIESYFTRLDDAVANLERVQRNLKRYRASVLKSAVEGRLVPTEAELARAEGRDYEPASVLLERILTERRRRWEEAELAKMEAKGKPPKNDKWKAKYKVPIAPENTALPILSDGWCWTTLDQLTCYITSGSRGWAKYYSELGSIFIRAQNLKHDALDLTELAYVDLPGEVEGTRTRVEPGDLLITITGANVTKAGFVPAQLSEGYVSQHVGLCRPLDILMTRYLHLWSIAPSGGRSILEEAAYGAGKPGLNLDNLRRLLVPLPPTDEFVRVVEESERLLSVAEETDRGALNAVRHVRRLNQAVLKWAFEGKLVNQDASDEPATMLLERIKSEPETTPVKESKGRVRRKARSAK